ncbi:hypothetical protein [Shewanella psychrotolerans]|uniref:hypothetical protein n=1 Tax=Shewanella psychrotolerans TaxID=2864206 RepID=UPI001C65AE44|nr:hypothetical protein [Shewanella psychrotolerans]QYK02424.1 hypothetical protein K0I62_05585 [Shewanella psychrotolerans]
MTHSITAANAPSAISPEFGPVTSPTFDLSNPQHLAMRKLMADVYSRHANALELGLKHCTDVYLGMGQGLERVAVFVLNDVQLACLCSSLNRAMNDVQELYRARAAA